MEARTARMRAALGASQLTIGRVFGVGGDEWEVTHADGTTATLNGVYVLPRLAPMGAETPDIATPGDPSIRAWELRAPAGTDVRRQDVIESGTLRFVVVDVPPYEHIITAPLQELQFYHRAELWRINPATGRRALQYNNISLNIYPGGASSIQDIETGQVGGRETYVGNAELGQDIRENDQFRSIVTSSGLPYMPASRLTVTTLARWPAMLLLRLRDEG